MAASYHASVLVRDPTEEGEFAPAKTVEHGGKTYVVAAPGQRFLVEARVEGMARGSVITATMNLDGKNVGYQWEVAPKQTFKGWFAGRGRHTDFTFAAAAAAAAGGDSDGDPSCGSLGRIEVVFSHNFKRECGLLEAPGAKLGAKMGASRRRSASRHCAFCEAHKKWFYSEGVPEARGEGGGRSQRGEDKKFFLNPSLRASSSGGVVDSYSIGSWSSHFERDRSKDKVTVELQCETEATLSLRKILPPLPREHPGSGSRDLGSGSRDTSNRGPEKKKPKEEEQGHEGLARAPEDEAGGAQPSAGGGIKRNSTAGDDTSSRSIGRRRVPSAEPISIPDSEDDDCAEIRQKRRRRRRQRCVVKEEGGGSSPLWMWEEDRHGSVVEIE